MTKESCIFISNNEGKCCFIKREEVFDVAILQPVLNKNTKPKIEEELDKNNQISFKSKYYTGQWYDAEDTTLTEFIYTMSPTDEDEIKEFLMENNLNDKTEIVEENLGVSFQTWINNRRNKN